MSIFNSLNVSASGLTAQRLRMDIISQNIANINTTRALNGEPYRRKTVIFKENNTSFNDVLNNAIGQKTISGVQVSAIVEDSKAFKKIYDPTHPDADEDGYVSMPNVNIVEEMTNMISANRSYEANVTAINSSKSMAMKALEIGK